MAKTSGLLRAPRRFRRTTIITIWCCAVLIGIALSRKVALQGIAWPLGMTALFIAIYKKRSWRTAALAVIAGLSVGLLRGTYAMNALQPYQAVQGRRVVLQAVAAEDAVYGKNSQLTFTVSNVRFQKPLQANVPGMVKVSGFGEYMVYKGDVISVEGSLYRTRGGKQAQVSYGDIQVIARSTSPVDSLRRRFAAGLENALPEPAASFGLGILIGQRSTLPDDVNTQLAAVGLTHLVAVSGYNLTIIVDCVRRLTAKRSKYQSFMMSIILIGVFLAMTGLSASIVRAAIVSIVSLCAWYYGRTVKPLLLITGTAAVTALWNPLYEWGDIGWYLSFLAFFGVLVVAPLMTQRFARKEPKFLTATLIETMSAQVMTLPLILFIFQQVSFVSLLSNVLVVPLVPLAMLVALIAGCAGMWLPTVAGWVAWPATCLLTYLLDIAAVCARVPHAVAQFRLSLMGLIVSYGVILLLLLVMAFKKAQKRAIITDIESNI